MSLLTRKMQVSQCCRKIFLRRPTIFGSMSAFDNKVNLVQQKILKLSLQRGSTQFWQSSRIEIARKPGKVRSMSQIFEQINNFSENFCLKFFFEDVNGSFVDSIGKIVTRNREVFAPRPNMLKVFLKNLSLSPNFSSGHLESQFHKPAG